jgi:REP element-mobilizing transposase RayT
MQTSFFQKTHWKHRYSYGGTLRGKRAGRGARPLSGKHSLHLVFKANRELIRNGFRLPKRFSLIHFLIQKYALKFYVRIASLSIQGDHIHLHIHTTRRSNYQSFFRVVAGQIAQKFEKEGLLTLPSKVTDTRRWSTNPSKIAGVTDTPARVIGGEGNGRKSVKKLWKYRPFTRVVFGRKGYMTMQNYIQLNEKEARGEIPYRKERLRGLSMTEWELLWK